MLSGVHLLCTRLGRKIGPHPRLLQLVTPGALEERLARYAQARGREHQACGSVQGPGGEVLRGQALDGKEVHREQQRAWPTEDTHGHL